MNADMVSSEPFFEVKPGFGFLGDLSRHVTSVAFLPTLQIRTRRRLELTMATKTTAQVPKTPNRGRQAKAREPLTPSLTNALNNLSLRSASPIKQVAKF